MNFTAQFLTDMARNAGLNVFVSQDEHWETRIRVSYSELHILVKTAWDGHNENVVSAKQVEIALPQDNVFIPPFDQADRWTRTHHFAMLGWVVDSIQGLADVKARDERRMAA